MAKVTTTTIIDDIDGTEIDGTETVRFSIDGTNYEIDLGPENHAELRERLATFIAHARPIAGPAPEPARKNRTAHTPPAGGDADEIRNWAKAHDIDVADRGRISTALREQYRAANLAAA